MRILLTGGTGVIGQNLVPFFLSQEHELCLLVRDKSKANRLFGKMLGENCFLLNWDDLESEVLDDFCPELVFHLAGYSTSLDDTNAVKKLINSNILTGALLLDRLSTIASIKYFVNIGSSTEYYNNSVIPKPTYLYAATKTAFRSILSYYAQKTGIKSVHVVLYSVYGMKSENKRIMDYLLDGLVSEKPIDISPGEQKIDFIHIEDVLSAFKAITLNLNNLKKSETIFYAGSGQSYNLKAIAAFLEKAAGSFLNLNWGGLPYRERDMMLSKAPISKNEIAWRPAITLEAGIKSYVNSIT